MKIFDCFMYFDEEIILDLRLNVLNDFVDYFVIVESTFNHKGEKRALKFDKQKFKKFEHKIIYIIFDIEPEQIQEVKNNDNETIKSIKYINNAQFRENGQRNFIYKGLSNADQDDIIMISDVDEIPKLNQIDFKSIKEKIILFKQDMFYYKFNLTIPNFKWTGTKVCKFKNLKSPQWLRNIKDRRYPFFRIDIFFSNTKYSSVKLIQDGGWHFSNIKSAKEIEHKLRSYLHHREFDLASLSVKEIEDIIKNKQAIYDLSVDKTVNKVGTGKKLEKFAINKLPSYIQNNIEIFKGWID